MRHGHWRRVLIVPLIAAAGIMIGDCESGKEAIDEATGYSVIKQYQRSKENIEKIAD